MRVCVCEYACARVCRRVRIQYACVYVCARVRACASVRVRVCVQVAHIRYASSFSKALPSGTMKWQDSHDPSGSVPPLSSHRASNEIQKVTFVGVFVIKSKTMEMYA